jgi:hypothetical protein
MAEADNENTKSESRFHYAHLRLFLNYELLQHSFNV